MRGAIVAGLIWLAMPASAQDQEAGIRDTISRQFEAFGADDFARAFEYASPQLQQMFRTPENFRTMVTEGYPMVWHPAEVRYLGLREEDGALWQRVMVIDADGTSHLLDYRMIRDGAGWRIAAVLIVDRGSVGA
ncbi:DUF4864 domain-containing protein [Sulfitobacter sp. LCG007]